MFIIFISYEQPDANKYISCLNHVCVGVKIITQQMQPSKILPKPSSAGMPSSSSGPIMVVSSNGAIMTTKLVSTPTGTSGLNTNPKSYFCSLPG